MRSFRSSRQPLQGRPFGLMLPSTLVSDGAGVTSSSPVWASSGMMQVLMLIEVDRLAILAGVLGCSWVKQVLAIMGDRLEGWVGERGWCRRLKDDRFVVMVALKDDRDQAEAVLTELQREMNRSVEVQQQAYTLTVSVGMVLGSDVLAPSFAEEIPVTEPECAPHGPMGLEVWHDVWLRNAQTALLWAQEQGPGHCVLFDPGLHQDLMERWTLEIALRRAIAERMLRVHYQPIVDLANGEPRGFEALCRWEHPELGQIPPARFIPLADELGLIVELGTWVLETACGQMAAWQRQGVVDPMATMSVNVSARQFESPDFVKTVRSVLERTGLTPQSLALEVLEEVFDQPEADYVTTLKALKALGVSISMDDFGTGYSSLSRLTRLPVDTLKIDRSFVEQMERGEDDLAIVQMILEMAEKLGLRVVAEGASTQTHIDMLRSLGNPLIQGHFYGRALAPEGVLEWLAEAA